MIFIVHKHINTFFIGISKNYNTPDFKTDEYFLLYEKRRRLLNRWHRIPNFRMQGMRVENTSHRMSDEENFSVVMS